MKIIDQGIFNLEIDGDVAVMNFNPANPKYSEELIQSSFEREIKYLTRIIKYSWSPEDICINKEKRSISFKWYGNTCEEILPTDAPEQLEIIVRDLNFEKLYKPNFYPKCFYTDNQGRIHAYIFYSTSEYAEQPISMDFYKPILNSDRLELVEKISTDGKLDMGLLIKYAFNDYIKWPGDILPGIYKKVYGL